MNYFMKRALKPVVIALAYGVEYLFIQPILFIVSLVDSRFMPPIRRLSQLIKRRLFQPIEKYVLAPFCSFMDEREKILKVAFEPCSKEYRAFKVNRANEKSLFWIMRMFLIIPVAVFILVAPLIYSLQILYLGKLYLLEVFMIEANSIKAAFITFSITFAIALLLMFVIPYVFRRILSEIGRGFFAFLNKGATAHQWPIYLHPQITWGLSLICFHKNKPTSIF